jgi:hypothetical protein
MGNKPRLYWEEGLLLINHVYYLNNVPYIIEDCFDGTLFLIDRKTKERRLRPYRKHRLWSTKFVFKYGQ